jgi:alkanesulfonate monooxygenase SsuD/methylene tetrahydromethanopterin reductase-like flavin-dependent oxidoreductase (luciferase family)
MRNAVANPKPVQQPHPPIWIGSGGPSMLKLTARHADVWNASGRAGLEGAIEGSRELDEACAAIGRDPAEIRRSMQLPVAGDPAATIEQVDRCREAGFTEVILMLSGGSMPTAADPVDTAVMLAERVLPEVR